MLKIPVSEKDHIQGRKDAPIILVEYGDYECGFCGAAFVIVKQIQDYFGDRLAFVFRNFPLAEIHPNAELAAQTAEFAGSHNRFWEMHDLLYENQDELGLGLMAKLIESLKLPLHEFEAALKNHTYLQKVKEDFMGGVRSGVNGTPTFFINGVRYNGSYSYEDLVPALEQADLNKAG